MATIENSRAAVRAGEKLVAVGGSLRKAWNTLDLGWTFDDLIAYLHRSLGAIPEQHRGKVLGLVAGTVIVAVEQDRDHRGPRFEASDGTFKVEKREQIPVGERLWGVLNGERYCVIVSRDRFGAEDERWHISVSNERHLLGGHDVPTWRDFVAIVHQLRPGVPFVLGIPPRNMWMNKNPNVLHAIEVRDSGLVAHWQINAAQVAGTDAAMPS